jgi:hypothetical protein
MSAEQSVSKFPALDSIRFEPAKFPQRKAEARRTAVTKLEQ